ncbi:MAG TPA: segregation/condensation protein A [Kofleriaceae bacterium]|nr:segregation/condensation protein A [Kofleriaceae bacterium]
MAAATTTAMDDPSAGYKVRLDVFEGPLDLLLHLVKKHELDIFDIPISFITEKYLEYLDLMTALDLDIAGEYLLMAATLAHIKSRELLPTPPPLEGSEGEDGAEEVEADPRQELIRRLLEYQKYKEAAESLGGRPVTGRNVWTRGAPQEDSLAENVAPPALPPLAEVPVIKLIEALDRVLSRAKIKFSHQVHIDRISVSERINMLADRLEREGSFTFRSCFRFLREEVTLEEARHEAVVTFLAILEMAKLGVIRVWQGSPDRPPAPHGDGAQESDHDIDDDIVIARASDRPVGPASVTAIEDDYR